MLTGGILRRITGFHRNMALALKGVRISPLTYVAVDETAKLVLGKNCQIRGRYFSIGRNASLVVGDSALIDGNISIGDGCEVSIGDNFKLLKGDLMVVEASLVQIGDDCLIASEAPYHAAMKVMCGRIELKNNVNLRASVMVDGGHLTIDSNTFINQGSEVRCEERIHIGQYVYVSYLVDIFDTNTHPTDWRARQKEVDSGYPNRALRQERQRTAPISLGDHVWVGKMVAILKGVHIGARSVVGTRAVVTSSCPEDSLLAGNPATARPLIYQENHDLTS